MTEEVELLIKTMKNEIYHDELRTKIGNHIEQMKTQREYEDDWEISVTLVSADNGETSYHQCTYLDIFSGDTDTYIYSGDVEDARSDFERLKIIFQAQSIEGIVYTDNTPN